MGGGGGGEGVMVKGGSGRKGCEDSVGWWEKMGKGGGRRKVGEGRRGEVGRGERREKEMKEGAI